MRLYIWNYPRASVAVFATNIDEAQILATEEIKRKIPIKELAERCVNNLFSKGALVFDTPHAISFLT